MKKNSMKTKVVAVLMASALVVTSSPVEASAAAKISWKSAKSSMKVGKTATFKVKNAPKGAKVSFTSTKKKVASVGKKNGKVKALAAGKTVIKATVKKQSKTVAILKKKLTVKAAATVAATATPAPAGTTPAPAGATPAPAGATTAPAGATTAPAGATTAPAGTAPADATPAPADATTTPNTNTGDTATATPEAGKEEDKATATPEAGKEEDKATATPEAGKEEDKATATPEAGKEEDKATATPEVSTGGSVTTAPDVDDDEVIVNALVTYKNIKTVDIVFDVELNEASTDNFTLKKGNKTVAPKSVELSEDKKTVTLTFDELEYASYYTLVVTGLESGKVELPEIERGVQTNPKVNGYMLNLEFSKSELIATGRYNTEIIIQVVDGNTGEVQKDVTGIPVDLTSNYGTLSKATNVTITNGEAKTVLTSEFIPSKSSVSITATVNIENAPSEYKSKFAKATIETEYQFTPIEGNSYGQPVLAEVESNEADRVTLIFDKEINVEYFVEQYEDGTWAYYIDKDGDKVFLLRDPNVELSVSQDITNDGDCDDIVTDEEGNVITSETKKVVGLMPVEKNNKALELILHEDTPLYDNCAVEVNYVNTTYGINNVKNFVFTDARTPSINKVEAISLKQMEVTLSEAIPSKQSEEFKFSLDDGQTYKQKELAYSYGSFDPETLEDTRNVVTVTLLTEMDEHSDFEIGEQIYFESESKHALQATDLRDFAGLSDKKKNCENILNETNSHDFNAPKCNELPAVSDVIVESPEQIRVKFNCPVRFKTVTEAATYFTTAFRVNDVDSGYIPIFEIKDGTVTITDDYDKDGADGIKFANEMGKNNRFIPNLVNPGTATQRVATGGGIIWENEFFKVTEVTGAEGGKNSEFVIEMVRDWSKIYRYQDGTKDATQYQHNTDKFDFLFAKGTLVNDDNGLVNEQETQNLSVRDDQPTYLYTLEYENPKVTDVTQVPYDSGKFIATMNIPVQFNLSDYDIVSEETDYVTHNTKNAENGTITATIIGTNAKGKEEEITNVTVAGFAGDVSKTDRKLLISAIHENETDLVVKKTQTLQELVDDEGWDTTFKIKLTNIYDDSGNRSSESTPFEFEIEKTKVDFEITKVAAVDNMTIQGKEYDVVYVTFTKGVNAKDTSVSNAVNWIVDGVKVPTGFLVENDTTGPGNASVGYRRIMLMFPTDTLTVGEKHVLNANQALVSKDGTVLTGDNEWVYNVYETSADALASNDNSLGY